MKVILRPVLNIAATDNFRFVVKNALSGQKELRDFIVVWHDVASVGHINLRLEYAVVTNNPLRTAALLGNVVLSSVRGDIYIQAAVIDDRGQVAGVWTSNIMGSREKISTSISAGEEEYKKLKKAPCCCEENALNNKGMCWRCTRMTVLTERFNHGARILDELHDNLNFQVEADIFVMTYG